MELTPQIEHKFETTYHEKYVELTLANGSGGFKAVSNRRAATRHALENLLEGLQPKEELSNRVVSLVEYPHLGIRKGSKGTIVFYDESDDSATVAFDNSLTSEVWMDFSHEIRRITE
jgi:hypothetical protein